MLTLYCKPRLDWSHYGPVWQLSKKKNVTFVCSRNTNKGESSSSCPGFTFTAFCHFPQVQWKKDGAEIGESIKYAIDWRQPNKNFGHMAYSWAWGRLIAPRYSLFQAMINEPWQSFNRSDFKMSRVSQKSGQNRLICWMRSARGCGFSGSPAERVPYLKLLYSCTHFWKNMPTDLLICTNSSSHTHSLTHRYTHTQSRAHSAQTLRTRTLLMKPRTKTAHCLCEKQIVGKHPDQWISSWQASAAFLPRPAATKRHPPPLAPNQYLPLKHQPLDKHSHKDRHTHKHRSIYYSLKRSQFSLAKRPVLLIILCINKWQICAT